VDLQLLEEDQLANFQGRVVDGAGDPVKGASIQWFHSELMNDFWFRNMALTDAQGRFEFKGLLANEPVYFSASNGTRLSAARHPVVQANVGETVVLSDLVLPPENSNP